MAIDKSKEIAGAGKSPRTRLRQKERKIVETAEQFVPAEPSDWGLEPPETLSAALDQVAASNVMDDSRLDNLEPRVGTIESEQTTQNTNIGNNTTAAGTAQADATQAIADAATADGKAVAADAKAQGAVDTNTTQQGEIGANATAASNAQATATQALDDATGSATVHVDIQNTGSGSIITSAERVAIGTNTAKVSANLSIDEHSDVDTTTVAPISGDVLEFDGTNFVPAAPSGGGGGGLVTLTVTLTPAQVQGLTTPMEILPAVSGTLYRVYEVANRETNGGYQSGTTNIILSYDSTPFGGTAFSTSNLAMSVNAVAAESVPAVSAGQYDIGSRLALSVDTVGNTHVSTAWTFTVVYLPIVIA